MVWFIWVVAQVHYDEENIEYLQKNEGFRIYIYICIYDELLTVQEVQTQIVCLKIKIQYKLVISLNKK
jgi:arginine/ornithine N-succinyltransferase beta subunit